MLNKEHLTESGLQKIVNLRASLNLGLSDELKKAFPNTIPVKRKIIIKKQIPHPQWVAGFASAEGFFFIKITKGKNLASVRVQILFQIAQHVRDILLMKSFINYFNCGQYIQPRNKDWGYYQCTKFTNNFEIIRSFFNQYPIQPLAWPKGRRYKI